MKLAKEYEQLSKEIKYNAFKLAWYMRGSFTYEDVMYNISSEDKSIIGDIIKENIEFTKKTNISML